jgi:processive 1,2-diacylglycerol beta-glucosyltransferase
MRALILSVSIGSGHTRASHAVVRGLESLVPGIETRIVDTFRYANPLLGRAITGAYIEALRLNPSGYRQLYNLAASENLADFGKKEFNRILHLLMATRLISLVAEFAPDVIVATHPFPLGLLSVLRQREQIAQPLACIVTDYTAHPFWLYDNVDLYAVGSEKLRRELCAGGIPEARVTVSGIPIDQSFTGQDRRQARHSLGLADEQPLVLLMSGGLGLGPLEETVRSILSLTGEHRLLAVCGNNGRLKRTLDELRLERPDRLLVRGYVSDVDQLMAAADLLVFKPGGLTCAEALASGLPMVIPEVTPGPEDANADHLVDLGAALRVRSRQSLVDGVDFLLRNEQVREVMRSAAHAEGRPGAATAVAEAVLQLCGQGGRRGGIA